MTSAINETSVELSRIGSAEERYGVSALTKANPNSPDTIHQFPEKTLISSGTEKEMFVNSLTLDKDELEADGYERFPTSALPEPVASFVRQGAAAIGCDEAFLALPMLAVLGSAIGMTRRIRLKQGWCEPPIIWTAVVGTSGSSKTPAFKAAKEPLEARQLRAFEEHSRTAEERSRVRDVWESNMAKWKKHATGAPPPQPSIPPLSRLLVSDTTVEGLIPILRDAPRGVLMVRDELSGWFGSFDRYAKSSGGGDASHWLSIFNADAITIDRKTGDDRTISVSRPAVCIAGGIQPAVLQRAIGSEHRENGMLARFLFAYPPRRTQEWTEETISPEVVTAIDRLIDQLLDLDFNQHPVGIPEPVDVPLSSDGRSAWIAFFNKHEQQRQPLSGDFEAAWVKLRAYAARLALIIHFVRCANSPSVNPDTIDAASVRAGIALVRWFGAEAKRVYTMLARTKEQADRILLVQLIRRNGGVITARELMRSSREHLDADTADLALAGLAKAKLGTWEQVKPTGPGRPTRRFRLFPAVMHDDQPDKLATRATADVQQELPDEASDWGEV
jgi:hypothetical protein